MLEMLSPELLNRVLVEAFQLLRSPGLKIQSQAARDLLAGAGAEVKGEIVRLPERVIRRALATAPGEFCLYARSGEAAVRYGGEAVQFNPGSCGLHMLQPETLAHQPARTPDLIRLIQAAEMLPQYAAQSTALLCHDVPQEMADWYRLYLVLLYSAKPVVTGAFSVENLPLMFDMLAICAGGREALARRPLAIFDVAPSPPLTWSAFAARSLIELARARIPAQIVSMPLAGATAPVTLLGTVVQHTAETLGGVVIHQLARPGSPVVWGGAATIFDMRQGTTPVGAIETGMLAAACAQVGRSVGLPTQTYLGASDSQLVDAQAGLESGLTALIGAQAGINMISGGGMLDFLTCQSAEKLVIDAEIIGMIQHLLAGIQLRPENVAAADFRADFLKQKATRDLFRREQYLPSGVIDRGSDQRSDIFERARSRVADLLAAYERPTLPAEPELRRMASGLARQAGLERLAGDS